MDIFEKFFHIWNLWGPMHLSIIFWSWSGKNSESWYSLMLSPSRKMWFECMLKPIRKMAFKLVPLTLILLHLLQFVQYQCQDTLCCASVTFTCQVAQWSQWRDTRPQYACTQPRADVSSISPHDKIVPRKKRHPWQVCTSQGTAGLIGSGRHLLQNISDGKEWILLHIEFGPKLVVWPQNSHGKRNVLWMHE